MQSEGTSDVRRSNTSVRVGARIKGLLDSNASFGVNRDPVATSKPSATTRFRIGERRAAEPPEEQDRRALSQDRNRVLGAAFTMLIVDAILAVIFCLLAPSDSRLSSSVNLTDRQLHTVYVQNFVALLDAILSVYVVVHVVSGILQASLDAFLEAAATKLLQATFFSLLQV
jgi:succinate dehydrogenase hydrophobic anchor subunit